MNIRHMTIFQVIVGGITVLSLVAPLMATAGSKDGKKPGASSPAAATPELAASAQDTVSPSIPEPVDRKPGPAWKMISGTIKQIKGDIYTVEDYEGNQVQLYISRETKQLRSSKKVGDRVRAEITHSGFANSIQ